MQNCVVRIGGLDEDRGFIGIDSHGQPIDQHLIHECSNVTSIGVVRRERMPVGDEEKTLILILQGFPIVQRAKQIPQV